MSHIFFGCVMSEIYMVLLPRGAGLGGHPSLDAELPRGVDPTLGARSNLKLFMFSILFLWDLELEET